MNKAAALDELIPGLLVNISNSQVNRLRHFVRAGLRHCSGRSHRPPLNGRMLITISKRIRIPGRALGNTALSAGHMNAMGSDYIREVNVVKSARVVIPKCCWVFMPTS